MSKPLRNGAADRCYWAIGEDAMTPKEQDAFRLIEGGLELLRNAIVKGDPYKELELRANDLISDVRKIAWPDMTAGPDVHALRPRRAHYRRGWHS